mmetsp:Transcript_22929/g.50517  ORF Transcript_22929/g.50517 Transcript_22929/m.50517 type:complete len:246 (+) Transcript_22929:161-898(+)
MAASCCVVWRYIKAFTAWFCPSSSCCPLSTSAGPVGAISSSSASGGSLQQRRGWDWILLKELAAAGHVRRRWRAALLPEDDKPRVGGPGSRGAGGTGASPAPPELPGAPGRASAEFPLRPNVAAWNGGGGAQKARDDPLPGGAAAEEVAELAAVPVGRRWLFSSSNSFSSFSTKARSSLFSRRSLALFSSSTPGDAPVSAPRATGEFITKALLTLSSRRRDDALGVRSGRFCAANATCASLMKAS